jgi:hypothetical protein
LTGVRADAALRGRLLERVEALGGDVDLGRPEHADLFPELWDAYTLPGTTLVPMPDSHASTDGGGRILVNAQLYRDADPVVYVKRRILLGDARALHYFSIVQPRHRGQGVNTALLTRSFPFYEGLGVRDIYALAGRAGRWFAIRAGYEFASRRDLERVRGWAREVVQALDIRGVRVDRYETVAQFAAMGGDHRVSLRELAAALPDRREWIEAAAAQSQIAMDARLPLGRAVITAGPRWFGRIALRGDDQQPEAEAERAVAEVTAQMRADGAFDPGGFDHAVEAATEHAARGASSLSP